MSQATAARVESTRKATFQVGVSTMAIWVLAAAVYFAMVRGARGFWLNLAATRPLLDIDRVVCVFLMAPATLIAAWLLADAIRLARRGGSAFGIAWRVAAIVGLAAISVPLSTLVRDGRDPVNFTVFDRPQWRIKLAALVLAIGMIGLLLGVVSPRKSRRARPTPTRRWVAASVVVAGLAGVGLMAYWRDILIPYLVMIAIDAVAHSLHRPAMITEWVAFGHAADPILRDPARWLSLDARIVRAGLDAAVGLVACGLAAAWIGRDLRRPAAEVAAARSTAGTAYRLLTAVAAWGMGSYLVFVSLPRLHPNLAEGFGMILEPGWGPAIVASFLALAGGLAARGIGRGGEVEAGPVEVRPSRGHRLLVGVFKLGVAAVLIEVILTAVNQFRGGDALPWYAPHPLSILLGAADNTISFSRPNAIYFDAGMTPDAFFLFAAATIVAVLACRFLVAGRGEAPIDRIGRDRRLIVRFLATWTALAGVMLTLLPAFFLAGFAVLHLTMRAAFP